MKLSKSNWI